MTLEEIITKAIPAETCPVKNAAAMHRRQVAISRLKQYISDELAKQFNATCLISKFNLNGTNNPQMGESVSNVSKS